VVVDEAILDGQVEEDDEGQIQDDREAVKSIRCQAPKMFRVKLSSNCTSYFAAEILLLKLLSHMIQYNLLA